jgi:ubiquinone/menaquinone biosynthesis C-methylase UbiE
MSQAIAVKPYKGLGMEGFVARWYASLTGKAMEEFRALARRIAAQLPPDSHVLEIAPGPGYFAIELAKLGRGTVAGVDISRTFVDIARRNAAQAGVEVDFRQGDAAKIPFPSGSFDFLLCRAAFKNFSQPVRALQEMYRVLKPGARAMIIDLRRDASKESISRGIDEMHLGLVNTVLTKLTFRCMLLKRAYTLAEFERMVSETGFGGMQVTENLIGLELTLTRVS